MQPYKKLKKFKVLVGIPTYEGKNYCLEELINSIHSFTYKHFDIMFADNSETEDNAKMLRQKYGVRCDYIKRKDKGNKQYMAETHEALRAEALRGGYDFLLHLESDVIAPAYTIEQLLSHQKTVVNGCYMIHQGVDSALMVQVMEEHGISNKMVLKDNDMNFIDGTLKQVHHAGIGCCLIHKSVLKKFVFRWEKENITFHPDSFFASDIAQQGIKNYVDTSLILTHRNQEWSQELINS